MPAHARGADDPTSPRASRGPAGLGPEAGAGPGRARGPAGPEAGRRPGTNRSGDRRTEHRGGRCPSGGEVEGRAAREPELLTSPTGRWLPTSRAPAGMWSRTMQSSLRAREQSCLPIGASRSRSRAARAAIPCRPHVDSSRSRHRATSHPCTGSSAAPGLDVRRRRRRRAIVRVLRSGLPVSEKVATRAIDTSVSGYHEPVAPWGCRHSTLIHIST